MGPPDHHGVAPGSGRPWRGTRGFSWEPWECRACLNVCRGVVETHSTSAILHGFSLPSQTVRMSFLEQVRKALYRRSLSSPAIDGTWEFLLLILCRVGILNPNPPTSCLSKQPGLGGGTSQRKQTARGKGPWMLLQKGIQSGQTTNYSSHFCFQDSPSLSVLYLLALPFVQLKLG